ncbi:FUSC family protein [Paracoccus luteus]|uniref:FUSC family protein n=1 Tax=Paracoccus luteus TaxID=2508543 RepID=UPI00106F6F9C|nr:FUSC family protein [Paracoccus luteus]
MRRWLSRHRWQLVHALRTTTASVLALGAAHALGFRVALPAVIAAIMVTQGNVGGSLKMATQQFVGSLAGGVYAALIILAVLAHDPLSGALTLAIALAPLAVLAALSPGYRIAPVTAAIVLLGGPDPDTSPLAFAADRILGVGLGCAVGLVVSILVMPARASRSVVETGGQVARLLAGQLRTLASRDARCQAELGRRAGEIRENLIRLDAFVAEAEHERRARLARVSDGQRLLRTLRRVRHDVDMIRRAAREAGNVALHDCAAASWRHAVESAAATLQGICRLLAGQDVPDDFSTLASAVRDYRIAVEEMQRAGLTQTLPTADLGRLFGIGFALEQLRRDLDDLIELSREVSSPRGTSGEK